MNEDMRRLEEIIAERISVLSVCEKNGAPKKLVDAVRYVLKVQPADRATANGLYDWFTSDKAGNPATYGEKFRVTPRGYVESNE